MKPQPILQAISFVQMKAEGVATGSWKYDAETRQLLLEGFIACDDMPKDVADRFTKATAEVPVTDTGLGIVLAARAMAPTEYKAEDLPPESGSGYWLRQFGADRSVAVPEIDAGGQLVRILSVAVRGLDKSSGDYAEIIRRAYDIFINHPE
jgi:hypothetical protein